jgi:hypothetical protein
MNDFTQYKLNFLPFKSVAVTLLFCIFLGPVGLLYSSVTGGIVMLILVLISIRAKLLGLLVAIWLLSCVWGVAATNQYNKKISQSR